MAPSWDVCRCDAPALRHDSGRRTCRPRGGVGAPGLGWSASCRARIMVTGGGKSPDRRGQRLRLLVRVGDRVGQGLGPVVLTGRGDLSGYRGNPSCRTRDAVR
jgi:hypothetical protein